MKACNGDCDWKVKGVDCWCAKCGLQCTHPPNMELSEGLWGNCSRCGRHFEKINSILAESIIRDLNAEIEWLKSKLNNA